MVLLYTKLGDDAGPFFLAGLLNWGGAKIESWRVDQKSKEARMVTAGNGKVERDS